VCDNLRGPPAHQQQTWASRNTHRQTRCVPNQTRQPSPLPDYPAGAAHGNPSRRLPSTPHTAPALSFHCANSPLSRLRLCNINEHSATRRHTVSPPADADMSMITTCTAHATRPRTVDARLTRATRTESSSPPMTAACPARQPHTQRKSALTLQPHRNRSFPQHRGQLAHRLTGGGEPAQLPLPTPAELRLAWWACPTK
jgi:hypothetical protein